MLNFIKSFFYDVRFFFSYSLEQRLLAYSFEKYSANKIYPQYLKFGGAVESVRFLALNYCKGEGVDVGSGIWPLNGARPIENHATENAYKINALDNSLDYVFSSHLLEHLGHHQLAINEWRRVLSPSGILFLYLPHPVCKMWAPQVLKEHVWMPDPIYLRDFLPEVGFEILDMSFLPDAMMSYYIVCKKNHA
jgi:SAM-dependent methyltransferase